MQQLDKVAVVLITIAPQSETLTGQETNVLPDLQQALTILASFLFVFTGQQVAHIAIVLSLDDCFNGFLVNLRLFMGRK